MTESEIRQWRESRTLYPQTTFQALRGPDAGDCIRTAVCTLLQIDPAKLTNWMTLESDGWSLVMERELAAFGWHLYPLPFDYVASADPEIVCVLQGTTSSGFPHCVVGTSSGTLLWDPLGGNDGLASIEQAWIFLDYMVPGARRGFDVLVTHIGHVLIRLRGRPLLR